MARKRYLEGADKVRRVFARIPAIYQDELTDALNKGGRDVAAAARTLALPARSDDDVHVSDDISHRLAIRPDGGGVAAIVSVGSSPETANAAFRQEFGRDPGGEGIEGHPGHDPQPFFFAGYAAVRSRVRNRIARARRSIARRIVGLVR